MTEKEAAEVLKNNYPKTCKMVNGRYQGGFDNTECNFGQALTMAIKALKEVQQYRKIGTVEECREAMEKQIPKKPVCKPKPYNESVGFNEEWFCPSCGVYIGYFYEGMDEPEQMEYCNECGQHIARDWSDKFDDE